MNNKDDRQLDLQRWAKASLTASGKTDADSLLVETVNDDASFRRYFRGHLGRQSYILVDAPPEYEDSASFIAIAQLLKENGINVPIVHAADLERGFMLLSDLGDDLYFDVLQLDGFGERVVDLYADAFAALVELSQIPAPSVPAYSSSKLIEEMGLFRDWFVEKQLKIELSPAENDMLDALFERLVASAEQQPQVFVHRDYHCRNLMVEASHNPGVIDFQDAVIGPITYDLVSLLKDCYWRFPREQVESWVESHRLALGLAVDGAIFLRWFDLMGMQRHLKCAGIFCRLNIRDGKSGYLDDIPLVFDYLLEVSDSYQELESFGTWLRQKVQPQLNLLVQQRQGIEGQDNKEGRAV
ncbi:MAG: phosphotransferase [Pseudomonadales bacterium]|nr:phosphotransferase [Pseudomonadales bacterium]MDG1444288.1 phosphotransferase [Pseudomonadales bacterium]